MNAKDFFEENKTNTRELWNLGDLQKDMICLLMEQYAELRIAGLTNIKEECSNCGEKVKMVSSGYFCPICYNEQ